MSKLEDSDEDDWFNKDDNELLKEQNEIKLKLEQAKLADTTEHIESTISYDEKYMEKWRLNAPKQPQHNSPKIPTSDLRKFVETGNALDVFLYALTWGGSELERADYFHQQITANDAMDRIFLYVRLYGMMAELKVPGFHAIIIKNFTKDEALLDQICLIATKMFGKNYKTFWKTDNNKIRLDKFISDVQLMMLQAHTFHFMTTKTISTIEHIKHLLKAAKAKDVINRPAVLEFVQNLEHISTETALPNATETVSELNKQTSEIYPNLDELLQDSAVSSDATTSTGFSLATHIYNDVAEYLNIQKCALRNDFMLSLADCVIELKKYGRLNSTLAAQVLLYEDVEIILNDNFLNSRRHEMLFVSINNANSKYGRKKQLQFELNTLKNGSLICLTTSYHFDNLILAVVTHQDSEFSADGCVAIEIVRQFNIGNIYNQKFNMFSSPAFFEPYHNVYNYLSTCSVDDFPMKDVVVFGKPEMTPPTYINDKTIYDSDKCKFKPLHEVPPVKLPLNISQREALQKVLTEKFVLIQGPPGTGKTHLSVQLVKLLLENETPKPIVVVAYTNESLDKFLLKILTYTTSIARLGGQTRLPEISKYNIQGPVVNDHVNPRLKRLHYVVNTEFKAAFEKYQTLQKEFDGTDEDYEKILKAQRKVRVCIGQLNTIRLLFSYYDTRKRSIIAMTTTCAAKMNFIFRLLGTKIVIVEEAAEILESHVLACLTPQTDHVIMIGDHMQLKPFTSNYQHSRSCDLNISLFERLITRGIIAPAVLLTQYRMRPVIAELMCPIFYNVLYNDDSVEHYPLVRGMLENLYFLQHDFPEKQEMLKPSFSNQYEVTPIINLANYLIEKTEYKTEDIVILTPYAKQCALFHRQLAKIPALKSLRAMTVDSFQGLEANIVLLSLVRSNKNAQIGFLQEKNRVCVALSRAKHGLYIMGNLKMLANLNDTWREIERKLSTLNLVGPYFPFANEIENTIDIDYLDFEDF